MVPSPPAAATGQKHPHAGRRSGQGRRFAEAEQFLQPVFDEAVESLGYSGPITIGFAELLVTAIGFQNQFDRGDAIARTLYEKIQSERGDDDALTKRAAMLLANNFDSWGKPEQYAQWLERAGQKQDR